MSARILEAVAWAATLHDGQRRKGEAAEPYVVHVIDVARRLADVAPEDENLILAGLLHDVVEDTAGTQDQIEARFGSDVAALVAEATDDKSLPKQKRKQLQVEHAPHKSARGAMLKIADKTSNLRALAESPPAGWDADRRAAYLEWAETVVFALPPAHPGLLAEFRAAARAARRVLGVEA